MGRVVFLFSILFNGHEFEQTPGDSEGQGSLGVLQSMRSQRVGQDLVTEQQTIYYISFLLLFSNLKNRLSYVLILPFTLVSQIIFLNILFLAYVNKKVSNVYLIGLCSASMRHSEKCLMLCFTYRKRTIKSN